MKAVLAGAAVAGLVMAAVAGAASRASSAEHDTAFTGFAESAVVRLVNRTGVYEPGDFGYSSARASTVSLGATASAAAYRAGTVAGTGIGAPILVYEAAGLPAGTGPTIDVEAAASYPPTNVTAADDAAPQAQAHASAPPEAWSEAQAAAVPGLAANGSSRSKTARTATGSTAETTATARDVAVAPVLRLTSITTSVTVKAGSDGSKAEVAAQTTVEGVTAAGTPVTVTNEGLAAAGTPDPAALLEVRRTADALKAAGIGVHVAELEVVRQASSQSTEVRGGGVVVTASVSPPAGESAGEETHYAVARVLVATVPMPSFDSGADNVAVPSADDLGGSGFSPSSVGVTPAATRPSAPSAPSTSLSSKRSVVRVSDAAAVRVDTYGPSAAARILLGLLALAVAVAAAGAPRVAHRVPGALVRARRVYWEG